MSSQTMLPIGGMLLSPKDASIFLGIHPKTFRRWAAASGIAPTVARPNCRRFTREQVLAIANKHGGRP